MRTKMAAWIVLGLLGVGASAAGQGAGISDGPLPRGSFNDKTHTYFNGGPYPGVIIRYVPDHPVDPFDDDIFHGRFETVERSLVRLQREPRVWGTVDPFVRLALFDETKLTGPVLRRLHAALKSAARILLKDGRQVRGFPKLRRRGEYSILVFLIDVQTFWRSRQGN